MKKGVSLILALILVIMITIAIATAAYYWAIKVQGELQASTERSHSQVLDKAAGNIEIKTIEHKLKLATLEIVIQNAGTRELKALGDIGDLVILSNQGGSCTASFNSDTCDNCPFDLSVGEIKLINLDLGGTDCANLEKGMKYDAYFAFGDDSVYTAFIAGIQSNVWEEKIIATKPSARMYHSMASMSADDKIVLFGGDDASGNCDGSGSSLCNGTWIYDLSDNAWTQGTTAVGFSARYQGAAANIYSTDKLLFFGGRDGSGNCDGSGNSRCNGTWIYDLSDNTWTQGTTAIGLTARGGSALATVYGDDKIILFGGSDGSGNCDGSGSNSCNGTWIYDLSDNIWTNMAPSTSPGARYAHAMSVIYSEDKILLFGGIDSWGYDAETWIYDLSDNIWVNKNPAYSVTERQGHQLATISNTDKIVVFGGDASGTYADDTWLYDVSSNGWTEIKLSNLPDGRYFHSMASIQNTNKILLFGGQDASSRNGETWILS